MSRFVPPAQWYLAVNSATTATTYPAASTNGVLVPNGKLNEYAHVLVDSNAGCSIRIVGMTSSKAASGAETIGNKWAKLQEYSVAGDVNFPWAERLTSITAYERIDVQRTDTNANATVNAYVGFCEHWRS